MAVCCYCVYKIYGHVYQQKFFEKKCHLYSLVSLQKRRKRQFFHRAHKYFQGFLAKRHFANHAVLHFANITTIESIFSKLMY